MKTSEFIEKVRNENYASLSELSRDIKSENIKLLTTEIVSNEEHFSYASQCYRLEDGIVEVTGLYKKDNKETSWLDIIDYYGADYCSAEIKETGEHFVEGDLVEFIDKNPGSTGLSHESIYKVLGECQMKDTALNWIPAIIYETNGKTYVRGKEDFYKKFKLVETH